MEMKFEHRRQRVIPLSRFMLRVGRYTLFSLVLMFFSLGVGILGYATLGGLSVLDSFHMASMILTGMGPVETMTTPAAKIFSSLYALYSGIAFLSITAIFLSPVIHRLLHILQVERGDKD